MNYVAAAAARIFCTFFSSTHLLSVAEEPLPLMLCRRYMQKTWWMRTGAHSSRSITTTKNCTRTCSTSARRRKANPSLGKPKKLGAWAVSSFPPGNPDEAMCRDDVRRYLLSSKSKKKSLNVSALFSSMCELCVAFKINCCLNVFFMKSLQTHYYDSFSSYDGWFANYCRCYPPFSNFSHCCCEGFF